MTKRTTVTSHAKLDLLPLPAADRDRIVLEYHLTLATLRAGQGDHRTLAVLTGVLVTTHYLLEAGCSATPESRATFRAAQDAINRCDLRQLDTSTWRCAEPADFDALAALIVLHDRQLAFAPRHAVAHASARCDAYWADCAAADKRRAA